MPLMAKSRIAKADTPARTTEAQAFQEFGQTGLRRYSGYVIEEFLKVLQGRRAAEIFREMASNDAVVGAMLFAIEFIARGATWRVESATQSPEDLANAAFIDSCRQDLSTTWADLITEILSMLPYGWAYFETVLKRRNGPSPDPTQRSRFTDGLIGWRKIAIRSQDSLLRWEFGEDGGVQAMVQMAPPTYQMVTLPIDKCLLFRPTTWKANPEGFSILRRAYRSWFLLKRMQEYEAIGVERELAGYPVMQVKSDPTTGQPMGPDIWNQNDADARALFTRIETIVKNIRQDEQMGLVLPHWLEFKLVTTGGRRQIDTDAIITRYEQRIAMTTLADFILLGHDKVGSFALGSSKTRLFGLALNSFLDSLTEVFNRHAIPRLLALNGRAGQALPRLVHGPVDTPDLVELGQYVANLAQVGLDFSLPAVQAALLEAAKLPIGSASAPGVGDVIEAGPLAKGNGHRRAGGWRYDPDRRLFVKAVEELREHIAKHEPHAPVRETNGHAHRTTERDALALEVARLTKTVTDVQTRPRRMTREVVRDPKGLIAKTIDTED